MAYVYTFLSAAAAWGLVALLIHLEARQVAANGAIAGAFCALLAVLLPLAGITVPLTLAAMLLLVVLLPLQQRPSLQGRLMNLLLSVGSWAFLDYSAQTLQTFLPPIPALALFMVILAAFLAIGWAVRPRFPQEDWVESKEPSSIHSGYIWGLLAAVTVLELSLRYVVALPGSLAKATALLLGYGALLWGTIGGVCLLVAYRQERLTTLVDQNYRNEMQSFMSVIRSQRHDYNFHVQALAGLINEGNLDECRRYVNNLVRDSAQMNTILPVKDPAIGALIFSFRTMAMEYGIELHLDIQNDMSSVVTSVYETNKVIGNLLQNAIDEVRTHKDKSFGIHLYILKRGENCIIHVANKVMPKDDPTTYMEEIYQPGHTTKEGHEGIGLNSIQNLLRRYRGVVYSRLEGDIIHFIAKIPMELQGDTP